MYCKYCGTDVAEGARFCENCGAAIERTVETPTPFIDDEFEAQKNALGGSVFALGLTGLIFSNTSLALFGIILSAIGLGKARKYKRFAGVLEGRAKAGAILSRIGLAVGIVTLLLLVLLVVLSLWGYVDAEVIELYS